MAALDQVIRYSTYATGKEQSYFYQWNNIESEGKSRTRAVDTLLYQDEE